MTSPSPSFSEIADLATLPIGVFITKFLPPGDALEQGREDAANVQAALIVLQAKEPGAELFKNIDKPDALMKTLREDHYNDHAAFEKDFAEARAKVDSRQGVPEGVPPFAAILTHPKLGVVSPEVKDAALLLQAALRSDVLSSPILHIQNHFGEKAASPFAAPRLFGDENETLKSVQENVISLLGKLPERLSGKNIDSELLHQNDEMQQRVMPTALHKMGKAAGGVTPALTGIAHRFGVTEAIVSLPGFRPAA